MTTLVATLLLIVIAVGCAFRGWGYWAWVIPAAGGLGWWSASLASPLFGTLTVVLVAMALVFGLPTVRRAVVSRFVMRRIGPLLPVLGDTERIALEAGTVWWDRDLFSGAPDWRRLLQFASQPLSAAEQAFLDGPVEELCAMLDQPAILRLGDLPPNIWEFLKRHRFFGLIIPESFGGLGFSAAAHSAVISKIGSRSTTAAVTVMVPNSLGPAELLLHYGTDEQKARYLPRLATGEEIPCFALTGPEAGSDAAATQSVGIVSRGRVDGEDVLGIRLNWHKRYITLGPVATLIGLAFRLRDPDHLIGNVDDLGITVALIPADLPGIEIGARHDPMGVPFQNGPNPGSRRVRPGGGDHRRAVHGRPRLADADGKPCRRAVDLAARVGRRFGAARHTKCRRVRNGARAVQHPDWPIRRRRGAAGADRRLDLPDARHQHAHRRRSRCRGAPFRTLRNRQGLSHRGDAAGAQRRDGHTGPVPQSAADHATSLRRRTKPYPSRSPSREPTSSRAR